MTATLGVWETGSRAFDRDIWGYVDSSGGSGYIPPARRDCVASVRLETHLESSPAIYDSPRSGAVRCWHVFGRSHGWRRIPARVEF